MFELLVSEFKRFPQTQHKSQRLGDGPPMEALLTALVHLFVTSSTPNKASTSFSPTFPTLAISQYDEVKLVLKHLGK